MMADAALPPNFLVVGAPRAATTSLHYYLAQHPDVAMSSIKEPNYFLFDAEGDGRPFVVDDPRITAKSVSKRAAYAKLFPHPAAAIGEASPLYLYTEQTPGLVARTLPDVRIIAILRNPAERALSHFSYIAGGEPDAVIAGFEAAVRTELPLADSPYQPGSHNLRVGRYAAQLQRWGDVIPRDRLLVLDYRELTGSPAAAMRRVSEFLGVDSDFVFDVATHYNPSTVGAATSLAGRLDRLIQPAVPYFKRALPAPVTGRLAHRRAKARATSNASRLTVPPSLAATLAAYFAADIEWVRTEFGIDLSAS
jgi:Sulfotransferase family